MSTRKRWSIRLIIAAVIVVSLACGTGYATTRTNFNNNGKVVLKAESIEGTAETTVEIDEDYTWEPITVNITVEVSAGTYRVTFVDNDDRTVTVEASAGNPGTNMARLTTDSSGYLIMRAEGNGAEDVVITIEYSR